MARIIDLLPDEIRAQYPDEQLTPKARQKLQLEVPPRFDPASVRAAVIERLPHWTIAAGNPMLQTHRGAGAAATRRAEAFAAYRGRPLPARYAEQFAAGAVDVLPSHRARPYVDPVEAGIPSPQGFGEKLARSMGNLLTFGTMMGPVSAPLQAGLAAGAKALGPVARAAIAHSVAGGAIAAAAPAERGSQRAIRGGLAALGIGATIGAGRLAGQAVTQKALRDAPAFVRAAKEGRLSPAQVEAGRQAAKGAIGRAERIAATGAGIATFGVVNPYAEVWAERLTGHDVAPPTMRDILENAALVAAGSMIPFGGGRRSSRKPSGGRPAGAPGEPAPAPTPGAGPRPAAPAPRRPHAEAQLALRGRLSPDQMKVAMGVAKGLDESQAMIVDRGRTARQGFAERVLEALPEKPTDAQVLQAARDARRAVKGVQQIHEALKPPPIENPQQAQAAKEATERWSFLVGRTLPIRGVDGKPVPGRIDHIAVYPHERARLLVVDPESGGTVALFYPNEKALAEALTGVGRPEPAVPQPKAAPLEKPLPKIQASEEGMALYRQARRAERGIDPVALHEFYRSGKSTPAITAVLDELRGYGIKLNDAQLSRVARSQPAERFIEHFHGRMAAAVEARVGKMGAKGGRKGVVSAERAARPAPQPPSWVVDAMRASGLNPDRIMNETDVAQHRALLAADPLIAEIAKRDPSLAARMRSGDASRAEILAAIKKQEAKPSRPDRDVAGAGAGKPRGDAEPPAPRIGVTADQVAQMSHEEIVAAHAAEKEHEKGSLVRVFGEEGARRYAKLDRDRNSSDHTKADAAQAEIEKMEAGLTKDQERDLFGVGETGLNEEELRAAVRASELHTGIKDETDAGLESLVERSFLVRHALGELPDRIRMARVMKEVVRRGWSGERVESIIKAGAQRRGIEPDDAMVLVRGAMRRGKQEPKAGTAAISKPKSAERKPEVPAPVVGAKAEVERRGAAPRAPKVAAPTKPEKAAVPTRAVRGGAEPAAAEPQKPAAVDRGAVGKESVEHPPLRDVAIAEMLQSTGAAKPVVEGIRAGASDQALTEILQNRIGLGGGSASGRVSARWSKHTGGVELSYKDEAGKQRKLSGKALLAQIRSGLNVEPAPKPETFGGEGRKFKKGDRVTVPYGGKSKKIARERATVTGYIGDRVIVEVRHGGRREHWPTFPESMVRRRPKPRPSVQPAASKSLPKGVVAGIEKEIGNDHAKAVKTVNALRAEVDALDAKAKALYPQMGRHSRLSREEAAAQDLEYRRVRGKLRRAEKMLELAEDIKRRIEDPDPTAAFAKSNDPTGAMLAEWDRIGTEAVKAGDSDLAWGKRMLEDEGGFVNRDVISAIAGAAKRRMTGRGRPKKGRFPGSAVEQYARASRAAPRAEGDFWDKAGLGVTAERMSKLARDSVVLHHSLVTSGGELLRKRGGWAGKVLADGMDQWITTADRRGSRYSVNLAERVDGMKKEQLEAVGRRLAGITDPTPGVGKAVAETRKVLDDIFAEAEMRELRERLSSGDRVPVRKQENYFPQEIRHDLRRVILKPGHPAHEQQIAFMMKSRPELDRARALKELRDYVANPDEFAGGGGLQHERRVELHPDLREWNVLRVLPRYFMVSARRLERARFFGPDDAVADALTWAIAEEGGDGVSARILFDHAVDPRPRQHAGLVRAATDVAVVSFLTTAGLAQYSQLSNTIALAGFRNTIRGVIDVATSKEIRRRVEATGATARNIVHDFIPEGATGGLAQKWSWLIRLEANDRQMRMVAGASALYFAPEMARQFYQKPTSKVLRRRIERLGLDPAEVLEQKGVLTEDQLSEAAQRLANRAQFAGTVLDLPPSSNLWLGRLMWIFKKFAYQQGRFNKQLVKDAAAGDAGPLLRYLATLPAVAALGELAREIRGWLSGKKQKPPSSLFWRAVEDILMVQAFGTFGDLLVALSRGTGSLVDFAAGPVISQLYKTAPEAFDAVIPQPDKDRRGVRLHPHKLVRHVLSRATGMGQRVADWLAPAEGEPSRHPLSAPREAPAQ